MENGRGSAFRWHCLFECRLGRCRLPSRRPVILCTGGRCRSHWRGRPVACPAALTRRPGLQGGRSAALLGFVVRRRCNRRRKPSFAGGPRRGTHQHDSESAGCRHSTRARTVAGLAANEGDEQHMQQGRQGQHPGEARSGRRWTETPPRVENPHRGAPADARRPSPSDGRRASVRVSARGWQRHAGVTKKKAGIGQAGRSG